VSNCAICREGSPAAANRDHGAAVDGDRSAPTSTDASEEDVGSEGSEHDQSNGSRMSFGSPPGGVDRSGVFTLRRERLTAVAADGRSISTAFVYTLSHHPYRQSPIQVTSTGREESA